MPARNPEEYTMNYYYWFVIACAVFDWIFFSVALFILAGKLKWKKKWPAFIPGFRLFSLGDSVELAKEGLICGIFDGLFLISTVVGLFIQGGRTGQFFSLIHFVLFVFLFSYRIRIFLQIISLFGVKKSWLIPWFIANWLPLLIFGIGKKFQPDKTRIIDETGMAGQKPADIASAPEVFTPQNEGLSIQLKKRTVRDFGKKRYLLKDVCLNIPNNSLVLLLGGSGAGKTTLINAIIGYEKADAKILLNGTNVYKKYKSVKHKIGFVPQQNLIRTKDTVIKTVNDAADLKFPTSVTKEEREKKIKEVLDLLGLSSGQDGLVAKKSGGQLRRICIAMELVTDPELFILDEPDSGLDGVISREIFTKLRQIANENRIVIAITHTPDRVIDLFDKVIVLGKDSGHVGRLAFYGSPDEAKEFFGRDSMEEIVMCMNSTDEGGEGRADEFIEKFAAYRGFGEKEEKNHGRRIFRKS